MNSFKFVPSSNLIKNASTACYYSRGTLHIRTIDKIIDIKIRDNVVEIER